MENTVATEISKGQETLRAALKSVIEAAQDVFGLGVIETAGVLGIVVGDYVACHDDTLAHDTDYVAEITKIAGALGAFPTVRPCYDTFMINVEYNIRKHTKIHEDTRASMKEGEQLLQKLCESHSNATKKGE